MRPPAWLWVVLVGALAGLLFAGISTYDFVQHLDRQVHSIHCSFIPGGGAEAGASGCQAAMMSPYSSVLRTKIWGGVPISLAAMAVFAFIGFYGLDLLLSRRKRDPRATGFLVAACALPALTSIVMLIVSLTKLGTTCKLCVGIYLASAMCLTGAIVLWRQAVRGAGDAIAASRDGSSRLEVSVEAPPTSTGFLAGMFGIGVAFVLVPVALYFLLAPDHGKFIGTCDVLQKPDDTYGVMVQLDKGGANAARAIELLDPLCPACRAFEARLDASGLRDRLDRKAILFPLDNTCNWMITDSTHPGACTISEAVLCAGDRAALVIEWSFANQERIIEATKADPTAAARIVKEKFPELASCVGSAEAKSKVNKSLRWAVANNIRVLTPQLFVDNVKLCDEDVDLGLEYALSIMLDKHAAGTLQPPPAEAPPAAPPMTHDEPVKTAKPVEGSSPAGTPTDKPAGTTETPADNPAGTSTDKSNGTSTDNPAGTSPAGTSPAGTSTTGTSITGTGTSPAGTPTTGTPTDKPAGTTTDKPAGTTDKAPGTATDKPATPPADKSATPPADKPATPPADKPAAPADQPVTKPSDTSGGG